MILDFYSYTLDSQSFDFFLFSTKYLVLLNTKEIQVPKLPLVGVHGVAPKSSITIRVPTEVVLTKSCIWVPEIFVKKLFL